MRFVAKVVAVVGVGVLGLTLLYVPFHLLYLANHRQTTGAGAIASHPMPTLFSTAAVTPLAVPLGQQASSATRLMQGWWSTHDTHRHDKLFAAWLGRALPAPPSSQVRAAETRQLERLARGRTPAGMKAAQWLQTYGGRDLWQSYELKQAASLPKAEQHLRKKELKKVLTMSKQLGKSLDKRLQQSAPFVTDPALRHGTKASTGKICPCSYPSAADAAGEAGSTFMSQLYPQRASLYRHMSEELAYAQMYAGTHVRSDVDAGSLLGDMVAQYFLVTRNHVAPGQVAAAVVRH